jgi:hypothetical protein
LQVSLEDTRLQQVRVCAEISMSCVNYDPSKIPNIQSIIKKLDEIEGTDEFTESGVTSSFVVQVCSRHELI